jgi:hypothetical protein
LAVFDGTGKLISSARLERPLFITGKWSQETAEIMDPASPAIDDSNLGTFGPKLITDILASLGRKAEDTKGRVS